MAAKLKSDSFEEVLNKEFKKFGVLLWVWLLKVAKLFCGKKIQ
jgi:hypothetical protein